MGIKITLSQFAQLMATAHNLEAKDCEAFLKSLFRQISGGLESDGIVKIKDFGTFKLTTIASRRSVDVNTGEDNEIPSHQRVVFVPSKELASAVNAPFEMFETLEINDAIIEQEIMEADVEGNEPLADELREEEILEHKKAEVQEREVEEKAAGTISMLMEPEEIKETVDNSEDASKATDPLLDDTNNSESFDEESKVDESVKDDENDNANDAEIPMEVSSNDKESLPPTELNEISKEDSVPKKHGFGHGFIWGIVVALLVIACGMSVIYYLYKDTVQIVKNGSDKEVVDNSDRRSVGELADEAEANLDIDNGEPSIVEDQVETETEVPTAPSDEAPVYDTITDTRYLTTMAKDHYGNYHFWPYIYKENSKMLGHPNRIRPGTRIVIPKLSKYGVNPKNKKDIEKAKQLGAEIYSRYQ